MRYIKSPVSFFNAILLFALVFSSSVIYSSSAFAEGNKYYIKVRNTKLRSAPQHFAPAAADLKLGDAITGSDAGNGWYKVSGSKGSGYLHAATLSSVKIITDGKKYNPTTDTSDVVLAGKGFNKEVEKEFSGKNPNLNFVAVNVMDQISIRDGEEIAFVKSGGLRNNG